MISIKRFNKIDGEKRPNKLFFKTFLLKSSDLKENRSFHDKIPILVTVDFCFNIQKRKKM